MTTRMDIPAATKNKESAVALFSIAQHYAASIIEAAGGRLPLTSVRMVQFNEEPEPRNIPPKSGSYAYFGVGYREGFKQKVAIARFDRQAIEQMLQDTNIQRQIGVVLENGDQIRFPPAATDDPIEILRRRVINNVTVTTRLYFDRFGPIDLALPQWLETYALVHLEHLVPEYAMEVVVPLFGFNSELDVIDVSDSAKIVYLRGVDKTDLWGDDRCGFASSSALSNQLFAIRFTYQQPTVDPGHEVELCARRLASQIIESLRLLGDGTFVAPFLVRRPVLKTWAGSNTQNLSDYPTPVEAVGRYILEPGQVASLSRLFSDLAAAECRPAFSQLRIALSRFDKSHTRRSIEDEVIDLMIALESSVLFGITQELSFRLALRSAIILRDECDPYDVSEFVKLAYVVRSKVVHEGVAVSDAIRKPGKSKGLDAAKLRHRLREIVRAIILKIIEAYKLGGSVETFMADIDRQVFACLRVSPTATTGEV